MNIILIVILTLGIIIIKAIWIRTEIKFSKDRINLDMIKTNAVEALIIILQIIASIYTPLLQTPISWLLPVTGIGMYIGGYILALWGRKTMEASWGIPGTHDKKKQTHLITSGPFAYSRNPLYVGFLMIYFGYAIAIQSWLVILRLPLMFYFYKSVQKEEAHLEKLFGKEYIDYKKKVPRFL